jgi:hypothetical protein
VGVEQQDRGGVGAQHRAGPVEDLVEHVVRVELGQ